MKLSPKIPDWLIALIITGLFSVFFFFKIGFLEAIELKSYDLLTVIFPSQKISKDIVIVAIDDESIAKLGRWPWPRTRMAKAIEWLSMAGARVIGINVLFSEPEETSGLVAIDALEKKFSEMGLAAAKNGKEFFGEMEALKSELNRDEQLASMVASSQRVIFPLFFEFEQGAPKGGASKAPEYIARAAVGAGEESLQYMQRASAMMWPLEPLSTAALDLGHVNRFPDMDGMTRWESMFINYGDKLYPSFPLAVTANYLQAGKKDLRPAERGVALKGEMVPTDPSLRLLIKYSGGAGVFPTYSFFDVINEKINPSVFNDKIVLVGMTGLGLGIVEATPVSPVMSSVEKMANVISNLLSRDFIKRPEWAELFGLVMILSFGLLTAFLLPKLGAKMGAAVTGGLIAVYSIGIIASFKSGVWLPLTYPVILLTLNYIAVTSTRYFAVERQKNVAEAESDEANKLLGLTFQGKGMLDLAFEKFKAIPANDEIKGLLYNLALDFERKRMPARAIAVYEHIAKTDKGYKDIADRVAKLTSVMTTGIWKSGKGAPEGTAIMEGVERPTIGRYEIVEELGRGAMGVVYKGVDPKINREVAIKTVRFDEIDADAIQSVKERFFREAESAGKLTHPNIVTIFDVGDETDLAYIAMEILRGKTLEAWCKKGNLLPPQSVLKIVGQVCDALDYAHSNGIVHRDIKPANIMISADGQAKVTDFGIARIQSSSHTKTGVIMGTPSYMSPEQVAGHKVDGRSDLFSLGVMVYEMLTGEKPFKGDSLATIMFQITSSPPPPLKDVRPELHPILQALINKAIAKKPEERFQSGKEFANAIKICLGKMSQQPTTGSQNA